MFSDDIAAAYTEPSVPCCMSGCANCVWIKHIQDLTESLEDGGSAARKCVDSIQDENLKAFVKLELKLRGVG
jgi:hypothetical protein